MKKLFVLLVFFSVAETVLAQNPSYQQKLYYTCKVYGFVKYYHSRVNYCEVNWDSALVYNLPLIKNAVTGNDFNDALYGMMQAAGPMAIASTPLPDTLPADLKRNRNFGWLNDPVFRTDVKALLDTIKNNFRPRQQCWVNHDGLSGYGYLAFPYDDPILDSDLSVNYPGESERLMSIFRYWNIINYFNPYNYILDAPWDSTLYNNVLSVASATDYKNFVQTFEKISTQLNDAHVEGLTSSSRYSIFGTFAPKIVLKITRNEYVIVKSGYSTIRKGDVLVSVDGKTVSQVEDSLRPYISAGNHDVFRRSMTRYILGGDYGSQAQIGFRDSSGNIQSISLTRKYGFDDWYPNDTLSASTWKKWSCNIGYVHMGNLTVSDVDEMYSALKETKAIIFDIRNYPNGTAWQITDLMYPDALCYAKLTVPDVHYPGTHSWEYSISGHKGNVSFYKGKVIILCNQETQSHAEYSCMMLRAMPNSVVVGSQTAGADGNITGFNLSRDIKAGFTTLGVYYPDGTETQRVGIVPDSVVYPTAAGIRQGKDEVLEKALQIAGCDMTSIVDEAPVVKAEVTVYPNPFSGNTNIEIDIASSGNVEMNIFNEAGDLIRTLHCEGCRSGRNIVHWNCLDNNNKRVRSGTYFCEARNGGNLVVKKMIVVK
jgi:carboxyl-terminal processing protease